MNAEQNLSRRTVLKVIGTTGAMFILGGFTNISCTPTKSEASTKTGSAFVPNAYVAIHPDGTIAVTICRSDMGQGVRTSLAMLLAEELDADWQKVTVQQAQGKDGPGAGEGTGGSSSIRSQHKQMLEMGAAARQMLLAAAATKWGVQLDTCSTDRGKVFHSGSGQSFAYGDLIDSAAQLPVPPLHNLKLKDRTQYKILGKRTNRIDNADVVTGKAVFGLDVKLPGMKYAAIARPPSLGATLKSVDDTKAKRISGFEQVVKMQSGVAVVATDTWSALKGREALLIEWDEPHTGVSSSSIMSDLKQAATAATAETPQKKRVTASYEFPFLAHSTMEPMNAVADVQSDSCTVWAPTQTPEGALEAACSVTSLPASAVKVNVTLLGGGFGRRLENDYVAEAVSISSQIKAPVKLIWTKDDDLKNDFYRPMSFHKMEGDIGENGIPTLFRHYCYQASRGASQHITRADIPYAIPESEMVMSGAPSPVRTGAWRSVDHTQVTVANECFVDELAHAAGKDPLEFRRALLQDPRLKAVLNAVADKSGYGKTKLPSGTGMGIACFSGYGSYAAHVVQLTVRGTKIKLDRIWSAVDCGLAINPAGVEAQMQGGCSDGLSTALHVAITIEKGKVQQSSWFDYEWLKMSEFPPMEVTIIDSPAGPGGMGEVGYPSVPPAVANAIFSATGKRVRKFPIKIEEL